MLFLSSESGATLVRMAERPPGHGSPGTSSKAMKRAIYRLAAVFEPDVAAIDEWFREDPICGLGGRTAEVLIEDGQAWAVLRFLHDMQRHDAADALH
jgi:hypothetical protein